MTPNPAAPPPSPPPPPLPPLKRCGGCACWWGEPAAPIGMCTLVDKPQRRDAVGCPDWRRRSATIAQRRFDA